MSIFTFMNSLGGIISPMVLSWLGISFGNQAFLFAGIASAVIGIVCLAAQIGKRVFANSYHAGQANEAVAAKAEADTFA
jgi:membrane protein DedA with SNARE-associated domain